MVFLYLFKPESNQPICWYYFSLLTQMKAGRKSDKMLAPPFQKGEIKDKKIKQLKTSIEFEVR